MWVSGHVFLYPGPTVDLLVCWRDDEEAGEATKMWVLLYGQLCVSSVIVWVSQTCSCWGGPRCSHSRSLPSHSTCRCGRYVQQGHRGRWHTNVAASPGPGPSLTGTSGQTKGFHLHDFSTVNALLLDWTSTFQKAECETVASVATSWLRIASRAFLNTFKRLLNSSWWKTHAD